MKEGKNKKEEWMPKGGDEEREKEIKDRKGDGGKDKEGLG
jgi:hypothetical protein